MKTLCNNLPFLKLPNFLKILKGNEVALLARLPYFINRISCMRNFQAQLKKPFYPRLVLDCSEKIIIGNRKFKFNNIYPAGNCMLKTNNKNTRTWRRSGVFVINVEHISHHISKNFTWSFLEYFVSNGNFLMLPGIFVKLYLLKMPAVRSCIFQQPRNFQLHIF